MVDVACTEVYHPKVEITGIISMVNVPKRLEGKM
jgi:hypothetical protein